MNLVGSDRTASYAAITTGIRTVHSSRAHSQTSSNVFSGPRSRARSSRRSLSDRKRLSFIPLRSSDVTTERRIHFEQDLNIRPTTWSTLTAWGRARRDDELVSATFGG